MALGRRANIIDLQSKRPGNIELAPQVCGQLDELGVDVWTRHTKGFDTKLLELAITPFLRTFMPKHGALIPKPLLLVIEQSMLIGGSYATRSALRSKTQIVAIAIVKAVHLFFDNVGDLADRALEQLCLLEHRKPNLLITKTINDPVKRGFERLPC